MTTATTNAATDTTASSGADLAGQPTAGAPKEPSKMDRARALYLTLKAADYEVPEGSSIRKEFISKAQVAIADGGIGLTKNGAITYYNNLQNEAKGNPLYIKPKKATVAGVQGAEAEVAKTEETVAGDAAADAALVGGETVADEAAETTDEEENKEAE